jgi:penicillin-binding protein 1A
LAKLPTRFMIIRTVWKSDAAFSSTMFEIWDGLKRAGSAYSSFLYRYFKLPKPLRPLIDILDDMATFGTVAAFVLLAYALPPFSGTGDWWNRGREYAVTFTDQNGEIVGQRGIRQDDAIPLDEIPPQLIKAVLATEDARFFDHFGVDVFGTLRAVVRNARADGVKQGGSSITQQVAKNLFLSPERTIRRKVHEAFLSLWIEARMSKEDILKLYLDRSYLGGGSYGVEAASQFYFGKSVRDINLVESATLAGLFKAPTSYAPHANPEASRARTNVVLYRMLDSGFITQGELLQARRETPTILAKRGGAAPDWFLDWAYEDTLAVLQEHRLTSEYVIEVKTTIDRKLQDESQKVINEFIAMEGTLGKFNQGASVTMAPDGAVRAIIGGRDYDDSQFNRATSAKRQTGSAFKPFVYMAALLEGYKPDDAVVDGPVSIGGWAPKNYKGGWVGRTTLTSALAHSYNSVPVKLSIVTGRPAIIKAAHDAGIQGELETWPPMVLGTSALTLIDLTTGYATFAGGGRQAKPYSVLEIRRPTGEVIYSRARSGSDAPQTLPYDKVADLNLMMAQVVKAGTARRADLLTEPQAGKTGTNQSYRDAWYVGFTAHNVTGVWVGNDDFTPMNNITGGAVPAPIWKRIMEVADAGKRPTGLPGVPLDASYVQVAPAEPVAGEAPVIEETPDVSPESLPEQPDEVRDVLNGMFTLFEKQKSEPLQPGKATKKATAEVQPAKAEKPAAPKPPKPATSKAAPEVERKTLFDRLFRAKNRDDKAKKKKTLFNF